MSKDVIIAGAIVAACLGLVTVAFVVEPKGRKKIDSSTDTSLSNNDLPISAAPLPPSNDVPLALDPLTGNPPIQNGPGAYPPIGSSAGPGSTGNPYGNQLPKPPGGDGMDSGNHSFPTVNQPPTVTDHPVQPPVISEAKTHVVAAGETLGDISMKYYSTSKHWKQIAETNKVDANELQVGQKLTIPVVAADAPKPFKPEPTAGPGERTYKIKAGDTYYVIAKKELGNASLWKDLQKLNGVPSEELRVGQTIKLPAAKTDSTIPGTGNGNGAPAPAPTSGKTHTVAAGETLTDISKKYFGTTSKWKEIVKANPGVDPEGLRVGQKLRIPESAGGIQAATPPVVGSSPPSAAPSEGDYTVKAGDTLESIAIKELGNKSAAKKISEANPGIDARHLRIGQKLKLPGKTAKPAEATPAPAPSPSPWPTSQPTPPPSTYPSPAPSGFPSPTGPSSNAFPSTPSYPTSGTSSGGFPSTPGYPSSTGGTGGGFGSSSSSSSSSGSSTPGSFPP